MYENPSGLESRLRWLGIHTEVLICYLESVWAISILALIVWKLLLMYLFLLLTDFFFFFLSTKNDLPRSKMAREIREISSHWWEQHLFCTSSKWHKPISVSKGIQESQHSFLVSLYLSECHAKAAIEVWDWGWFEPDQVRLSHLSGKAACTHLNLSI